MLAVKDRRLRVEQAIGGVHVALHRARNALGHLVLKEAKDALEERLQRLFLVLHRVHKILQFFHIGFQSIHTDLFHYSSSSCFLQPLINYKYYNWQKFCFLELKWEEMSQSKRREIGY